MSEFRQTLAGFREAMREEGERSAPPSLEQLLLQEKSGESRRLRWAIAAGTVLLALGVIPMYQNEQKKRAAAQEKADTLLLEQVDESLSLPVSPVLAPLMGMEPEN